MDIDLLRGEATFTAVPSRGPGGQNVNKVASAAHLAWNVLTSRLLTAEQKNLVHLKLANKINKAGELVIRSDEYRDLPRNKERGLEKLYHLILWAITLPKKRKPTRPTKASKKRRLEGKTHRGDTKKMRQKVRNRD